MLFDIQILFFYSNKQNILHAITITVITRKMEIKPLLSPKCHLKFFLHNVTCEAKYHVYSMILDKLIFIFIFIYQE